MTLRLQLLMVIAALFDARPVAAYLISHSLYPPPFTIQSLAYPNSFLEIKHDVKMKSFSMKKDDPVSKNNRRHISSRNADRKYDLMVTALLRYKQINGDMLVPCKFAVPENSDWPTETWRLNLGIFVGNVRNGNAYTERNDELRRLGFEFEPKFNNRYGYDLVKKAMLRYKELYGNMLITSVYVVPDTNDWPIPMRGMKLGNIVNNVRRGSSYADKRQDLLEIGFDFESQHKYGYDLVKRGLLRYKEINGHINVPARFQIPDNHIEWPSELWNIKLGTVVHDIRRGSYADKKEELLQLGFVYVLRKKFDYECVKIAVYKYRELNHGDTKVPKVYNIPQNDLWYPEETWGMCLGSYANRIKTGSLWPDKYSDLFSVQE